MSEIREIDWSPTLYYILGMSIFFILISLFILFLYFLSVEHFIVSSIAQHTACPRRIPPRNQRSYNNIYRRRVQHVYFFLSKKIFSKEYEFFTGKITNGGRLLKDKEKKRGKRLVTKTSKNEILIKKRAVVIKGL